MKKIDVLSLFLFLLFLFLPVSTIMMLHHITLCNAIVSMDNNCFGKNKCVVKIENESVKMPQICEYVQSISSDIAVYQEFTEFENVKAIFFSNRFSNIPMLSGRFFVAEDFVPENACAVVGKKRENEIFTENGKRYINVNDLKFEVLGTVGMDNACGFDNQILINGMVKIPDIKEKIYILDFFKNSKGKFYKSMLHDFEEKFKSETTEIASAYSVLDSVLGSFVTGKWFALMIACDLLSILMLSLEWRSRRCKSVAIKRLLGCSTARVFWESTAQYAAIAFTASILSILFCTWMYPAYIYNIWLGFILFMPFVIAFVALMNASLLKASITEAIK